VRCYRLRRTQLANPLNFMKVNLPMQFSNAAEVSRRQICVVSILRNDSNAVWQSLAPRLLANKEHFCAVCGVRCLITSDQLSDRPASWDRIPLLQRAFRMGCEIVLWVDADAIFLGPLWIEGMARLAPLSFDSSTASNGLNAGVILARRTPMVDAFLRATWQEVAFTHALFWEQAALRYTLRIHPEWRQKVRLFSNLSLPEQLPPLWRFRWPPEVPTPMYHPAGCFSSPAKLCGADSRCLRSSIRPTLRSRPCRVAAAARELGFQARARFVRQTCSCFSTIVEIPMAIAASFSDRSIKSVGSAAPKM
jgi:hypothetical protein